MKAPYFGKVNIYWCKNCNVPLLEKTKCNICTETPIITNVTPPGDIYPAYEGSLELLKQTIVEDYGRTAFEKYYHEYLQGCVLFNKVSYDDRMDQVIAKGEVTGYLRYNLARELYEFVPSLSTARIMWSDNCKKYIVVDKGAENYISNGANVLAPGVEFMEASIKREDSVLIVVEDKVIAVSTAKVTPEEFSHMKKGTVAKKKYYKDEVEQNQVKNKGSNWKDAVQANMSILQKKEQEALEFINNVSMYNEYSVVVSYSGGKDSLAVLELISSTDLEFDFLFVNTGLEFPETIKNVKKAFNHYHKRNKQMRFLEKSVDNGPFWSYFKKFGPPSRDARYCCKRNKLSPVSELLHKNFPNQKEVLTFIGKRKYESLNRSKERRIAKNQWIPQQLSAFPILHWRALDVHLYILMKGKESLLNELYINTPLSRIGCWLCPASNLADISVIQRTHSALQSKLFKYLEEYRNSNNLPEEWITKGIWRWQKIPPKINLILDPKAKKRLKDWRTPSLEFQLDKINIKDGHLKIEVSSSEAIDIQNIHYTLNLIPYDEIRKFDEHLVISSYDKNRNITIKSNGSIIIQLTKLDSKIVNHILASIVKAELCDGCKACISICPVNALFINENGKIQVTSNCINCGKCLNNCPIWIYEYNEKVDSIINDIKELFEKDKYRKGSS